jgi:hypothetical protein
MQGCYGCHDPKVGVALISVKYFAMQSIGATLLPSRVLPQGDRSGQWIAGREALFDHLVEAALVNRAR